MGQLTKLQKFYMKKESF